MYLCDSFFPFSRYFSRQLKGFYSSHKYIKKNLNYISMFAVWGKPDVVSMTILSIHAGKAMVWSMNCQESVLSKMPNVSYGAFYRWRGRKQQRQPSNRPEKNGQLNGSSNRLLHPPVSSYLDTVANALVA
jgi:hypothetical protein